VYLALHLLFLLQSVVYKPESAHYKAQMNFITYSSGKWLNPFADKSGAYLFLPDGPSKVSKLFFLKHRHSNSV
jgi:hypothetical protein